MAELILKSSKRAKHNKALLPTGGSVAINDAFGLLATMQKTKFKKAESIDVAINLGVNTGQSDQQVRGAAVLPHGNGKTVKVVVFAEGDAATAATKAGADKVGLEDLIASLKKSNKIDFDVAIATPESMRALAKLAQVLGPKGLMPNPKSGTVTKDVVTAVTNAKRGQVYYRTDKAGIIHGCIGKMDFKAEQIKENLEALLVELQKSKPVSAKGVYLKKITLSSTMGPGIVVDQSSLSH